MKSLFVTVFALLVSTSSFAQTQCYVKDVNSQKSEPMRSIGANAQSLHIGSVALIVGLNDQGQAVSFSAIGNSLESDVTRIDGENRWMQVSIGGVGYAVQCTP